MPANTTTDAVLPGRVSGRALALLLLLAAAAGRASSQGEMRVSITSPMEGEPVFGEVEFAVEVAADEPIEKVEFFLDGILRGEDDSPPYSVRIDAGSRNVAKSFTAVAHGVSGETARATRIAPEVRIDLEMDLSLQQLYVTVKRDEHPVLDLDRDDFRVFDSGVEQRLVTFERGDVPMAVVLLIDASDSMRGEREAAALAAAERFLRGMRPLDEVMLLVFSDRPLLTTGFLPGSAPLELPVSLATGGGTALNDHLYVALRQLDVRMGRPVMLLLSDGADTLSFLEIQEILWKVHRSAAVVYRIRPTASGAEPTGFATSWRGFQENRQEIDGLERVIQESGGRVQVVPSDRLEEAIEAVIEELRGQYALGYYPSLRTRDGTWRPVRVEVATPGLWVRTRSGYVDQ